MPSCRQQGAFRTADPTIRRERAVCSTNSVEKMKPSQIHSRGSRAASAVENAWGALRTIIDGLPQAVIVVLDLRSRRTRFGHFAPSAWRHRKDSNAHEVGISPALFDAPEELLITILHEAVHALLFEKLGHGGCGPDGFYHRTEFRDLARELGLACEFVNNRYGWTSTGWPDSGVPDRYAPVLEILKRGLPYGASTSGRHARVVRRELPKSGHVKLLCGCGRAIYASRASVRKGAILCGCCSREFAHD